MPLSLKQLQDVCLQYSSSYYKRCRYLAQDELETSKWHCLKKSMQKSEIDDETSVFLADLKNKGADPKRQGVPLGDNCDSYPLLKHVVPGYDTKK